MLILNGLPMSEDAISRLLGLDKQILTTTLTTLLTTGVASRDESTGALMSRRMVRDEKLRVIKVKAGKLGGNPALLKQNPTTSVKQKPTPSVSSSVSSSERGKIEPPASSDPLASPPADLVEHAEKALDTIPDDLDIDGAVALFFEQIHIPVAAGSKMEIAARAAIVELAESSTPAKAVRQLIGCCSLPVRANVKRMLEWLTSGGWRKPAPGEGASGSEVDDFESDPEETIPDGLSMVQYRQFICERLGKAKSYGNQVAFQDAIEAVMHAEKVPPEVATRAVIERGRACPPEKGNWRFWVNDGGWKNLPAPKKTSGVVVKTRYANEQPGFGEA